MSVAWSGIARSTWRTKLGTSERKRVLNPSSVWIVHEDQNLRIVPQQLWNAVRKRQQQLSETIGARVRAGLSDDAAKRMGRGPKYLFSGLLRCGACGSNFTIASKTSYACASYVNGKRCTNDGWLPRDLIEAGLLAGIKRCLLSDEVVTEVRRRFAKAVNGRQQAKPANNRKQVAKIEAEIANLTDAIASGVLRNSPALATRLRAAEDELEALKAKSRQREPASVDKMLPGLVDRYRTLVTDLGNNLSTADIPAARTELEKLSERLRSRRPRRKSGYSRGMERLKPPCSVERGEIKF